MMRILAVGYICIAINQVFCGVMRGAGDTVTPMWISLLSSICLRVPIAYGLAALTKSAEYPNGSPYALYTSQLIAWSLGAVMAVIAFKLGKWRKKLPEEVKNSI
jgi:Na+-driven multidrug efflux pump